MISTIKKQIIETQKGCGKDLTLSNDAFCGEYNNKTKESYYCIKCRTKLSTLQSCLALAEETKEKLKEDIYKLVKIEIILENQYEDILEEIEKTFGGTD